MLGEIPRKDRTTCYMAYPKLHSMGTGKYASVAMERAGGRNVAEMIAGYSKVNMEQVIEWNPEVIFIQDRYQFLVKEIGEGAAWQPVSAVKNKRIYLCPEYVKPWGHPLTESMALGELWMAKKLYPEKFKNLDLAKLVDEFYRKFYGIPYDGKH
jgi:iron complex transport system substrate-binding protein